MVKMRKIAIINQKGGVGKTTTVVNLGSAIANKGKDTILIDLDPQAHLTMHLGIEPTSDLPNIYHVLIGNKTLKDILIPTKEHLRLAPATIDLAGVEVELATTVGREVILRDAIEEYTSTYDFLFMDCPPSLGILTVNALCAADEVFITLQPHFLALQGMGKLLETIKLVNKRINHNLKITGIILCMYETGTKLSAEVESDLRSFLESTTDPSLPWANTKIFNTKIRRNIKLAEAPSFGQDIFTYAPSSHGAEDYLALANELLNDLPAKSDDKITQYQIQQNTSKTEETVDDKSKTNTSQSDDNTNDNILDNSAHPDAHTRYYDPTDTRQR